MKALMLALVISLATNFIMGCLLWRTNTAGRRLVLVENRNSTTVIPDPLESPLLEVPKLSVSQDLLLKSLFLKSEMGRPAEEGGNVFDVTTPVNHEPPRFQTPRFQIPPKWLFDDHKLPADPFQNQRENQLKRGLYVSPSSALTS